MLNKEHGKDVKQEILKRRMLNKKYSWIDQQETWIDRNVDERDYYENVCARFCAICFFGPSDWLSNDDAPPLPIKYFEVFIRFLKMSFRLSSIILLTNKAYK